MKLTAALAFTVYLMAFPEQSLLAARGAMALWARSVAPALFPFMALMPVLSGEEARAVYRRFTGNAMRILFHLPPETAAAVMVGWLAGSPTGAMAVARTARKCPLTPTQALTAGILGGGVGPVFLICSVGAGMFFSAATGVKLFVCAWTAHFISGLIAARLPGRALAQAAMADFLSPELSAVRGAALGVITVCGWMVLFSVIGSALPDDVQPFLEVSAGCAGAAEAGNEVLAAFLCGFGGLCAGCQNMSALRETGVRYLPFFALKAMAGALSAGLFWLCARVEIPEWRAFPDAFRAAAMAALLAALLIAVSLFRKHEKHSV